MTDHCLDMKHSAPLWRHCICVGGLVAAGLVILIPLRVAADQLSNFECGDPFGNQVGPFDYTNGEDRSAPNRIPVVEKFHFTATVESLKSGSTSEYVMNDLDYTLRAVPNHHRALNTVARFDVERGGIPPRWRSAECWFDRARRFRPDDGVVWLIYGNWNARKGNNQAALEAYQRAKELRPESAEVDYNLGLLFFKMGDYESALASAKAAYEGQYPLQGLRRKLAEKGYSVD